MRYDTEPHGTYRSASASDTDANIAASDTDEDMSAPADSGHRMSEYRPTSSEDLAARSDGARTADGYAGDADHGTTGLDGRASQDDAENPSEVGQVTTHEHDARRFDEAGDGAPYGDGTDAAEKPAASDEAIAADEPTAISGVRSDEPPAVDDARSDDPTAIDQAPSDEPTAMGEPTAGEEPVVMDGARSDAAARGSAPVETAAATMWPDGTADSFRSRWREVQLRFVDDPQAATDEAGQLVGDVIDALAETFRARHEGAREWRGSWDTEALRTSVRRYRDVIDQLLSM